MGRALEDKHWYQESRPRFGVAYVRHGSCQASCHSPLLHFGAVESSRPAVSRPSPDVRGKDEERRTAEKEKSDASAGRVTCKVKERRHPMSVVFVGIDVGSRVTSLAALDAEGTVTAQVNINTSESNLLQAIESIRGEKHVHIEASELAAWTRTVLLGRVARIVVSHPKSNTWIAKDPLKNDETDACKLADLLRMKRYREVQLPESEDLRAMKLLVHQFDQMTRHLARLKNQIKARFRTEGIFDTGGALTKEGRPRFLAQVRVELIRKSIETMYDALEDAKKAKQRTERLLIQCSRKYPQIVRFEKVHGIGTISACRFFAYIQTPHRFPTKRKLWRYCQLGITDRSSDGKPLGYQRLDRNGNPALKNLSRTAFIAILKSDNPFRRAYEEARKTTGDKEHARLTIQRKVVAVLWAMWRNGTEYREELVG